MARYLAEQRQQTLPTGDSDPLSGRNIIELSQRNRDRFSASEARTRAAFWRPPQKPAITGTGPATGSACVFVIVAPAKAISV